LNAQFAANTVGARSVVALFDRYGVAQTHATIAAYLDFTEKRFRAAIDTLPAGRYEAEDFLDGNDETSVAKIKLALTIGDGKLNFDFAGTDAQLNCARNIPYRALLATVYTVSKALLDPEVPANAGYYRTLIVSAPAGSVVGPVPPAAIGCRSISASVLGDVIAAALSQALPHKALAGSGPHHLYVLSGTDPRNRKYFVNYETLAGGMGARAQRDGVDGVRVHASGSSNLPIEALEHAYPFRVERYALWEGSGGTGRYRGGMGVVRDYRVLADDIVVSLSSERQHVAAIGLQGGGRGSLGSFVLNPGTVEERKLPSAAADVRLPRDSVLRISTPSGGGYGAALERDAAAIERDRREGRSGTVQA
ncbi:MAG TPA: hydantoinase B/oxoprolinase family protein, partial [Burkholderiales bacterium]|nr:hydantoinase B/oxoprolinase family protein [Burkholderiales bacterium]